MKKTKLIGLTTLLLSLGISGCFGTGSATPKDDPDEIKDGTLTGTNDGHYMVDSKGNRISEIQPHTLEDYPGDATHVVKEPTCSLPGKAFQKCKECGKIVDKVLPVVDHDYQPSSDPTKAATCTRAGLEECTMCHKTRETGSALGHKFGAGEAVTGQGANDAAVKKQTCTVCNVNEYVIEVATAKMQLASGSSWKTDPSTGHFKLNGDGQSCSFTFKLPAGGKFKMYERAYMDSYSNNYDKKAFFATDSVCNIEVKVNNTTVDMSSQSDVKFSAILGSSAEDTAKSESDEKDVYLGEVNLAADNTITYKRVKTLNMIVSAFVFEPAE